MVRCKVCKSSFKSYYEELKAKGWNIPKIYDEVVKIGDSFSIQSLYRHFQSHYNPEGIKIIPSECATHIVIYIFKDFVDRYNIRGIMPILYKNLSKPYWNTKKELYKDIKKCVKELDVIDIKTFDRIWKEAINRPLYYSPFNNRSFNEYFSK